MPYESTPSDDVPFDKEDYEKWEKERARTSEQTDLRERLEAALKSIQAKVIIDEMCDGRVFKVFGAGSRAIILDAIMPILAALPLLPLLPQPAAPDEARVREWYDERMRAHREVNSPAEFEMLLDFARTFPPTPLRLSRDEIVKRGDAMTCPSCEKGLPKEANGDHNTDSIMTTCSCPSLYEDCTGRGTAIYELVLEAAMGPEQARELADTLTKHAIEAEKDYQ